MITSSNGNQYLRPDYLTPLPTTLDAKKSPLALLAQTCSQIGADTPATKAILSSNDKASKKDSPPVREKSSPASSSSSSASTSSSPPVSSAKSSFKPYESVEEIKPAGGGKMKKSAGSNHSSPRSSPNRKTPQQQQEAGGRAGDGSPGAANRAASPVKPPPLGSYLYPELMGLRAPYLGYPRLKGGDVPCRDPYCTGCHLLGKTCPAGCTQCEKAAAFLPAHHQHAAAAAAYAHAQLAALAAAASAQPYVCSWIAGDAAYCGKRFSTSEELLAHLRTHTSDSLLTAPPPPAHPALLHRTYPTPPLSPLATTARYHPYSKPALLPPSLTAPPFALPHHPGLPPYLSPYSLYGPRLGASHP